MPQILPPGLAGFVAAQENARRGDMANMQQVGGILSLQNALRQQAMEEELAPLKIQQLRQSVEQATAKADMRRRIIDALPQVGFPGAPGVLSQGAEPPPGGIASSAQATRGVLGGLDPMAALFMLSEEGGLGKIGAAIQEQNKPMAAREGAPIINPSNGQILFYAPKLDAGVQPTFEGGRVTGVSAIPGYAGAVGSIKGAEAQASEAAKVQEREIGGRKYTMSNAEFATLYGPDQQKAVEVADRYGIPYNGGPVSGSTAPRAPVAQAQLQPSPTPTPPASSSGLGTIPTSRVLGGPLPVNPTTSERIAAETAAKERTEGGVKYEQSILDAGRSARSNLTNLQLVAPNLDKMPSGPLYPTLINLQNYMQQFGLKVDPMLGQAQATDSVLKQFALKLRDPAGGGGMPGAMSDADREFLVGMLPGLAKSPQGNRQLIRILSAIEQRKIDEAQIVNKMQEAKFGTNEIREALNQYANTNSIAKALQ